MGPEISVSVSTPEEAWKMARYLIGRGVDCLKTYYPLSPLIIQAIVEEGRAHNIPVASHLEVTDARQAAEMGVTSI